MKSLQSLHQRSVETSEHQLHPEIKSKDISFVGWDDRIDDSIKHINRTLLEEDTHKIEEDVSIQRDANKMLSIAITTTILLAQKKTDIPVEYYMWTELYLRTIKNSKGEIPRNINHLLEYMEKLKEKNDRSWQDFSKIFDPNYTSNVSKKVVFDLDKTEDDDNKSDKKGYEAFSAEDKLSSTMTTPDDGNTEPTDEGPKADEEPKAGDEEPKADGAEPTSESAPEGENPAETLAKN